jgi:hypothetical protein
VTLLQVDVANDCGIKIKGFVIFHQKSGDPIRTAVNLKSGDPSRCSPAPATASSARTSTPTASRRSRAKYRLPSPNTCRSVAAEFASDGAR